MDFATLRTQGRDLAEAVKNDPLVKLVAGIKQDGVWSLFVWPAGSVAPAGFNVALLLGEHDGEVLRGIYERYSSGGGPWLSPDKSEAIFFVRPAQETKIAVLPVKKPGLSQGEMTVAVLAGELRAEADRLRASADRLEEMARRLEP